MIVPTDRIAASAMSLSDKTTESQLRSGTFERLLLSLDEDPWLTGTRVLAGFLIAQTWYAVRSAGASDWLLFAFFLAALAAVRVGTFAVRKLPLSRSLKQAWAERRSLAVRYDSYQLRKLLGFGIGLGGYAALSDAPSPALLALAGLCIAAGAAAAFVWRSRAVEIR